MAKRLTDKTVAEVRAPWRASKDELFSASGPSFETPRKSAVPQDDGAVVVSKEVKLAKTRSRRATDNPPALLCRDGRQFINPTMFGRLGDIATTQSQSHRIEPARIARR
jgi:hypothetical protein